MFAWHPPARILIEASTESEWVAKCLEGMGHEVIVADPNAPPMYATRSKRVKTDKRDARTLCEACRIGARLPGASDVRQAAADPSSVGRPLHTSEDSRQIHVADRGSRAARGVPDPEWIS